MAVTFYFFTMRYKDLIHKFCESVGYERLTEVIYRELRHRHPECIGDIPKLASKYLIEEIVPYKVLVFNQGLTIMNHFKHLNDHDTKQQLLLHSLSNFAPIESIPFAKKCYNEDDYIPPLFKVDYDRALHHYVRNNEFLPEHWLILNNKGVRKAIAMKENHIAELVASWQASSILEGISLEGYLQEHLEGYLMHKNTRRYLKHILSDLGVETELVIKLGGSDYLKVR